MPKRDTQTKWAARNLLPKTEFDAIEFLTKRYQFQDSNKQYSYNSRDFIKGNLRAVLHVRTPAS